MTLRLLVLALLLLAAGGSFYLLEKLGGADPLSEHRDPDYYLENFTTITMDENGEPKHKLSAAYMAHYPDDDSSELLQPKIEIFRAGKRPLYIEAREGRLSADSEVVFLQGDVRLWEPDGDGGRGLRVDTSEVTIRLQDEYAETDRYATITSGDSVITGTGMRAFLPDSRLQVIRHDKTTIRARPRG